MDFQPQINYLLPTGTPMPYFMAYPDHHNLNGQMVSPEYPSLNGQMAFPEYPCLKRQETRSEENAWQDFEYLRRAYPMLLGKWQHRVEEILDRMDYEGSMIYDEYPDRYSIDSLADSILCTMKQEATANAESYDEQYWKGMGNLIQVLLCNEIYKRRHGGRRGILKF